MNSRFKPCFRYSFYFLIMQCDHQRKTGAAASLIYDRYLKCTMTRLMGSINCLTVDMLESATPRWFTYLHNLIHVKWYIYFSICHFFHLLLSEITGNGDYPVLCNGKLNW